MIRRYYIIVYLMIISLCLSSSQDNFFNQFANQAFQFAYKSWNNQNYREVRHLNNIDKPSYVLATPGGSLYISSFMKNEVYWIPNIYKSQSQAVTLIHGSGLDGPWGMVLDNKILYVASFATDEIRKYNSTTGEFINSFGGEQYLDCPEGIVLGSNRTLYVASFLNDKVVKFNLEGDFLGVVADGSSGLKGPEDVLLMKDGSLLVTSHYSDNILKFNSQTGKFLGEFGKVDRPVGLALGYDGFVYVTSYSTDSIVILDSSGTNILLT
ncbi:E3 ubiquitin-protein ligase TRIM71 [Trichoplax sp. H2]|nr:E3 ubiquitin-protein ligase TRIM71 [Trichoplax sp. H2]|eukprot:RDD45899.1 E3 ubiquitin-protein ligase TRIM71 [Trichoplax sp. H2]